MQPIRIQLPITPDIARTLHAGDNVLLDGEMLVFRDAGHKRLYESILAGKPAFDIRGETVYFMGPCPAKEGEVIGSAGPTTSCRMDKYTPMLMDMGLAAQIGKGQRDAATLQAICRNNAVYFAAMGGCGAWYQHCIQQAQVVTFDDLGTEAVRRIRVKDFPVVVAADCHGGCIYPSAQEQA